jgi:hypothetical protein
MERAVEACHPQPAVTRVNNMALVLDRYCVHQLRMLSGKDDNALTKSS